MSRVLFLISCLLIGSSRAAPNVYDGYVKCADGSSPQKDESGRTLSCTPGQQTYASCQPSYQCTTPLAGRPGVCCKMGYVAGTEAPPTNGPPPMTEAPPPPPPETAAPPASPETVAPPASPDTMAPPPPETPGPVTPPPPSVQPPNTEQSTTSGAPTMGGGGGGGEMTPPPPTEFTGMPGDTTTGSASGVGGAGALETSYPTIPPEILETTPSIDSVNVVTDSNGMAIVSPNSAFEDRKHGNKTAQNAQKGQVAGQPKRVNPPAPAASNATKVIRSFNGATIVVKPHGTRGVRQFSVTTSSPKGPTSAYPMPNGRPLASGH